VTGAGRAAAVALAIVFAWAAVAKAADREGTADAFGALGLRGPAALALAVPVAELVTAVALVLVPVGGAFGALFLLVAFTVVLAGVVRRGVPVSCACFGAVSTRAADPVSLRSLVRNLVLLALASFVVAAAPPPLWG
jgi:hypothetical protein